MDASFSMLISMRSTVEMASWSAGADGEGSVNVLYDPVEPRTRFVQNPQFLKSQK